ncbi:hypothetical protein LX81_01410 [Palleronia aestuarii]|uniref:Uncharacterized protein n=1 Tax=Palleronia aestuarii TaxID=568105 RepID=A0A2W7NDK2_9RHOB|nr:hypothetical protein [Palleronia aestuarii]PZX17683.1 hypothetical protein LX81_01410 [Palleronia aestuarii]
MNGRAILAIAGVLVAATALPMEARNLCGQDADAELLARLEGVWRGAPRVSIVNETTSLDRTPGEKNVVLRRGTLRDELLDGIAAHSYEIAGADGPRYDVDAIDDLLETTGSADLADRLSDTRCEPEELPQFVAIIDEGEEMTVAGTVTIVAYFEDRLLEVTELTLGSGETILYFTATTLLVPAE